MDIEANKKRFIALYKKHITRNGADRFLSYLENHSDFFTAPASTRFHGSYEGGLCEHSLQVYDCLKDYLARPRVNNIYEVKASDETIAIIALLHDVCKIDFYKTEQRNKKVDGQWVQVPYYTVDDQLPYGHGEKSVYMISGYMRLSREEAFAIRYHMGFSGSDPVNNVGKAFEMFPIAFALSTADMEATYFLEEIKKNEVTHEDY